MCVNPEDSGDVLATGTERPAYASMRRQALAAGAHWLAGCVEHNAGRTVAQHNDDGYACNGAPNLEQLQCLVYVFDNLNCSSIGCNNLVCSENARAHSLQG